MAGTIKTNIWVQYLLNFVAFLGLCISIYGLLVEIHMDSVPNYSPLCDINHYFSCSKALMSKWGKGMGLIGPLLGEDHWLNQKNVVYGIIMYCFLFILAMFNDSMAADFYVLIVIAMNMTSIYLGSILYHLGTVCLVCVSIYIVNFVLLPLSIWRRRLLKRILTKKNK